MILVEGSVWEPEVCLRWVENLILPVCLEHCSRSNVSNALTKSLIEEIWVTLLLLIELVLRLREIFNVYWFVWNRKVFHGRIVFNAAILDFWVFLEPVLVFLRMLQGVWVAHWVQFRPNFIWKGVLMVITQRIVLVVLVVQIWTGLICPGEISSRHRWVISGHAMCNTLHFHTWTDFMR